MTKNDKGIKVFTSKGGSSKFKSVKVEAVMTGTIQKLSKVLMDVSGTKKWVYGTKEAYAVKKIGPGEIIYYSETSLPWPVKDRDAILKLKLNTSASNETMTATTEAQTGITAAKKGIVRITDFDATWNVKSVGKQKISITYILKMNPAGSVPAGITNMFLSKGPWETFNKLAGILN